MLKAVPKVSHRNLATVVSQHKQAAEAALTNEQVTRQRVDALEQWAAAFSGMTFWRRVRWLLLGGR